MRSSPGKTIIRFAFFAPALPAWLLTKKTSGAVIGGVNVISTGSAGMFAHALAIRAPALNNYTATILTIIHGIRLYSVKISYSLAGGTVDCDNEQVFVEKLGSRLKHQAVRQLLSSLLVQIKRTTAANEDLALAG